MKDTMDCAYFRGYVTGKSLNHTRWVAYLVDGETEQLLVDSIPHTTEMFHKATGQVKPDATEEEIVTALRWWAKGYCKGRMGVAGSAHAV